MRKGEEFQVSVRFGHSLIVLPFRSFFAAHGFRFCRCDPDTRTLSLRAEITICLIWEVLLILHNLTKTRKTFDL